MVAQLPTAILLLPQVRPRQQALERCWPYRKTTVRLKLLNAGGPGIECFVLSPLSTMDVACEISSSNLSRLFLANRHVSRDTCVCGSSCELGMA